MSSFVQAVTRHDAGRFLEEIDAQLDEVAQAVLTAGGKGEVLIRLRISANRGKSGEGSALKLTPLVTCKKPVGEHGDAFYYRAASGGLTREPPKDEADNLLGLVPRGDKSKQ